MPNQQIYPQPPSLDGVFHALADATRRAMVQKLAEGPASVSELAQPFEMAMPSLLQHLKVLEEARLVRSEKKGRVRTCHLEPAAIDTVQGWIDQQRQVWEARLDRLEAYLETLQADGD